MAQELHGTEGGVAQAGQGPASSSVRPAGRLSVVNRGGCQSVPNNSPVGDNTVQGSEAVQL